MKRVYPEMFFTGVLPEIGLGNGSRMTRECHVRFCERLRAKSSGSTHPRSIRAERIRHGVDEIWNPLCLVAKFNKQAGSRACRVLNGPIYQVGATALRS